MEQNRIGMMRGQVSGKVSAGTKSLHRPGVAGCAPWRDGLENLHSAISGVFA